MRVLKRNVVRALVIASASLGSAVWAAPTYEWTNLGPYSQDHSYVDLNNSTKALALRHDGPAISDQIVLIEDWSGGILHGSQRLDPMPGATYNTATDRKKRRSHAKT